MADRRDANEREIISALVAAGAVVIQMGRSAGFDLIVCHQGRTYIVEVKNLHGRNRIEQAEADTRAAVLAAGCRYYIIRTIDQALEMIGRGEDLSGMTAQERQTHDMWKLYG